MEQDNRAGSSDVNTLLCEAQERLALVEKNTLRLKDLTRKIDKETRCLVADVDDVVRHLDIKERFREKLEPVMERLDLLGSGSAEDFVNTGNLNLAELFREMEYCYTMDSERQVHQQFVAGFDEDASGVKAEVEEWTANRDHGLGDNVDLF